MHETTPAVTTASHSGSSSSGSITEEPTQSDYCNKRLMGGSRSKLNFMFRLFSCRYLSWIAFSRTPLQQMCHELGTGQDAISSTGQVGPVSDTGVRKILGGCVIRVSSSVIYGTERFLQKSCIRGGHILP